MTLFNSQAGAWQISGDWISRAEFTLTMSEKKYKILIHWKIVIIFIEKLWKISKLQYFLENSRSENLKIRHEQFFDLIK